MHYSTRRIPSPARVLLLGAVLAAPTVLPPAPAAAQTVVYDNTATQVGDVQFNGPVTYGANTQANMDADLLALAPGAAGQSVVSVLFEGESYSADPVTARPSLFFWADDGAGGNPGTFLASVTLPIQTFAPHTITPLSAAISGLTVPADGSLWAGIVYDDNNGTTGATAAQIGALGGPVYDPPTVGSSGPGADFAQQSAYAGVNNPAVIPFDFGGNPPVNYGWRLLAVAAPEPGPAAALLLGALGLGGLALRAKRRVC